MARYFGLYGKEAAEQREKDLTFLRSLSQEEILSLLERHKRNPNSHQYETVKGRIALNLFYGLNPQLNGLSFSISNIANRWNVTPLAVRERILRALRILRAEKNREILITKAPMNEIQKSLQYLYDCSKTLLILANQRRVK